MMTLLSVLLLGFFLGMRHATDADHVIAVTTIVSREHTIRNAALIGVVWGIGHSLTLLLVGGTIVFFGLIVPPRLGLSLEFSVALMLILLGLVNFRSFARYLRRTTWAQRESKVETCAKLSHHHDDHGVETNLHEPRAAWFDLKFARLGFYQTVRPLMVGIVHGLAGSAAVALLVLPMISRPLWAIAYLAVFSAGTIGGMVLITAAVALPFTYTAARSLTFQRHLSFAAGFLSVAFGVAQPAKAASKPPVKRAFVRLHNNRVIVYSACMRSLLLFGLC